MVRSRIVVDLTAGLFAGAVLLYTLFTPTNVLLGVAAIVGIVLGWDFSVRRTTGGTRNWSSGSVDHLVAILIPLVIGYTLVTPTNVFLGLFVVLLLLGSWWYAHNRDAVDAASAAATTEKRQRASGDGVTGSKPVTEPKSPVDEELAHEAGAPEANWDRRRSRPEDSDDEPPESTENDRNYERVFEQHR